MSYWELVYLPGAGGAEPEVCDVPVVFAGPAVVVDVLALCVAPPVLVGANLAMEAVSGCAACDAEPDWDVKGTFGSSRGCNPVSTVASTTLRCDK